MLEQIKAIQAKIGTLVADLTALSREVDKIENRDKSSSELEQVIAEKHQKLNKRGADIAKREKEVESAKTQLESYSQNLVRREKVIEKKESNKSIEAKPNVDSCILHI